MQVDFSKIKFDEKGLIPAIIQDAATNAVLMLAYMNGESLAKTVETGYTWFWSRSRQELWRKGDTSGKVMKPAKIATGYELSVPAFVEAGDKIEIDTRTGEYGNRVK